MLENVTTNSRAYVLQNVTSNIRVHCQFFWKTYFLYVEIDAVLNLTIIA